MTSSPELVAVIPHAEGAVEVEVDVEVELELGMGDSVDKDWVELVLETETGIPVLSATPV